MEHKKENEKDSSDFWPLSKTKLYNISFTPPTFIGIQILKELIQEYEQKYDYLVKESKKILEVKKTLEESLKSCENKMKEDSSNSK